jgi:hypothetical protein
VRDAGEDYAALPSDSRQTPLARGGIVSDGNQARLTEAAFLHDFADNLAEAKARVLYAVQESFHNELLIGRTTHAAWREKSSFYAVSTESMSSASWQSEGESCIHDLQAR